MISGMYIAVAVLAFITLVSGLLTVTLRNLYHCALCLALSLMGVAGLYVCLSAEFLAAAQVLIYVGAVTVLILFAVMMTEQITGMRGEAASFQRVAGAAAAIAVGAVLIAVIYKTKWPVENTQSLQALTGTPLVLGRELLTTYLIPFEVASVILLAALIGAVVLAKQETTQSNGAE